MKRFVIDLTSKSTVNTEDKITAYDNKMPLSHASHTLDSYKTLQDLIKYVSDYISSSYEYYLCESEYSLTSGHGLTHMCGSLC